MTKTFINFKGLRVYGNDTMRIENGELKIRTETLPKGVPFLNYERFKNMPQKCQQCSTVLKNKKKYYLGNIVKFDTGYWTFQKICRKCGNPNIAKVIGVSK